MNNAVNFKFSFETDDYEAIHNLMPLLMQKIKKLQRSHQGYRTIEFNIAKPARGKKTACLTIHHPDSVVREDAMDESWEHAIETVFNNADVSAQHTIKLG
ncbi:MAG: hypothetical protein EOO04_14115 [Chitinophagaceae bacterium]|nr:MAG: hypothetical protein EOO04_14115 [Chitinophagaceae bacterium]